MKKIISLFFIPLLFVLKVDAQTNTSNNNYKDTNLDQFMKLFNSFESQQLMNRVQNNIFNYYLKQQVNHELNKQVNRTPQNDDDEYIPLIKGNMSTGNRIVNNPYMQDVINVFDRHANSELPTAPTYKVGNVNK